MTKKKMKRKRAVTMGRAGLFAALACLGAESAAVDAPRSAVAVLPSGKELVLAIAADPASRGQGLMFREKLGPREGMLFVFEEAGRHGIWMKNCLVPLDILWLDEALRVVDLAPDQPPCPEAGDCPSVRPLRPARFVIEVGAGTARAEGLRLGDKVVLLSEPALP